MNALARPDLSTRTALSKSALLGFDYCKTAAWYDIHERRDLILDERIVFGSAVDVIVEVLIKARRQHLDSQVAFELAADEAARIQERDGFDLDSAELARAAQGFWNEVMPRFDWSEAATQPSIDALIPGLGPCNGHPDIILPGSVWDVKAKAREPKAPFLEIAFYAILIEHADFGLIEEGGYFLWHRLTRPVWKVIRTPITRKLRSWAWERAQQYVTLKAIDAERNAGRDTPINEVFAGGPTYADKCLTCPYAPRFGGSCRIAWEGDDDEAA